MTTAKPKRPASLQVGYIPFTVRYLTDEEWASANMKDGEAGQCDGAKAEILVRLQEGVHEVHVQETLLHEVLHACFYASGVSVENRLRSEEDIEETVVSRVSPVLLSVLRANPQLAAYLTS